jgi:hypothetical protein
VGIGLLRRHADSFESTQKASVKNTPTPATVSRIVEEASREVLNMTPAEVQEALKEERKERLTSKKVKEEVVKE